MATDFAAAVEDGLKLSKRIYFGKDRAVTPPKAPVMMMDKSASEEVFLPTSPMVYAVIHNPGIVDNPDIPSYQPHVHGRCDPPALIPLQMNRIVLEADSYLDRALVRLDGSWRVHCVMGSKNCDCRIAIPMGEQGSILGVEVEVSRKSYCTEVITLSDEERKDLDKESRPENGGFLKPNIFSLTIPKIDGGSTLSIKVAWMQKLLYKGDGEFSLVVPFSFPEYVTPAAKKLAKKERIRLNVNSGTGTEIVLKTTSHPLKQLRREVGKLGFIYEADVLTWTNADFAVSYTVPSSHIFGGMLLQSPSVHDVDQREMFCLYLFPGNQQSRKVFRKEIVFLVDISGSMEGKAMEGTKSAISAELSKLDSKDSFNIIAFNGETYQFSSSLELASEETIQRAIQWMNMNFIAGGSTNILVPLNKAIEMVSGARSSIPIIFLVTDGAVEDERHICDVMKTHMSGTGSILPRICTFGIGTFCNHHFLRMLATVSRGQYDAAYDIDSLESRLQKSFSRALSTVLANITTFHDIDNVEIYPSNIPDLSSESPLIVSGRYQGNLPDTLKAEGVLGDSSKFLIDLKVHKSKDIPLDKVVAQQEIDILTAQAWFSESRQLEEKVAKISIQTGLVSEYTRMSLVEMDKANQATVSPADQNQKVRQKLGSQKVNSQMPKRIFLRSLCVGFGNLSATAENIHPGAEEPKLPEAAEMIIKAASNCCGKMFGRCCCMCCIQCCSQMNDQCAIVLAQFCTALAFLGCFECCSLLCCSGGDGQ